MLRRNFVRLIPAAGVAVYSIPIAGMNFNEVQSSPADTRKYWVDVLKKVASPVLNSLGNENLRKSMPVECSPGNSESRTMVTHLEAFGRLVAGMSPWLELGEDNTGEGELRKKYIELTRKCISISVNPSSPDFMNFTKGGQPLVDAAFLAHGLVRGFTQLWQPLDDKTKKNLIDSLKLTRAIKPG